MPTDHDHPNEPTGLDDRDAGRRRARDAVATELRRRGVTPRRLALQAGLSGDTVNDFLNGVRWPRSGSLGKIEAFLGWPPGHLDRVGAEQGTADEPVEPADSAVAGVLLDIDPAVFADLDPNERAEVVAAAKLTYLERAREIRRSRGAS
jgi:lambda repressor-like predicted transcriptional regulator